MPGEEKERNEHKSKLMNAKLNFITNPRRRVSGTQSHFRAYVVLDEFERFKFERLNLTHKTHTGTLHWTCESGTAIFERKQNQR